MKSHFRDSRVLLGLVLLGFLAACATNPVTGRPQFVLMSEAQEIALGQQSAPQIAASMGLYDDPALERYVAEIGMPMAKASERPHLPWEFHVVDDPLVNAFAVPGGFIYVTRGILAHFANEAQLASVLGHEIGHVTARHSVAQQTKAIGVSLVLLPTVFLTPNLQALSQQLLGATAQVLLLKYSRDDESQADDLGFRYMTAQGYAANEMPKVFHTLDRIGAKAGADGIPEWLSSHPKPANREAVMKAQIARLPDGGGGTVGRDIYLRRVDGMVYGPDPRHGFFSGDVFHHPDLAFRWTLPPDWKQVNQRAVVGAVAPDKDALVQLSLAAEDSPRAAADAFLSAEGMQSTPPKNETLGGLQAVTADFAAAGQQGTVRGVASFVRHGDHVYRLIGFAPESAFAGYDGALRASVRSMQRERSSAVLNVKPWRIDIVTPGRSYTVDGFARAYPGPASAEELSLLNQIEPGGRYPAGVPVKRVVGQALP